MRPPSALLTLSGVAHELAGLPGFGAESRPKTAVSTLERVRSVSLWLPFEPAPKGRPQVTWRRGRIHAYTPTPTLQKEREISSVAQEILGPEWKPFPGPVRLLVDVLRPVTKVLPVAQRTTGLPSQRPDLDNYLKLIIDALSPNKTDSWGMWRDDAQIVEILARKSYAFDGCPGWFVVVEELVTTTPNWPSSRASFGTQAEFTKSLVRRTP